MCKCMYVCMKMIYHDMLAHLQCIGLDVIHLLCRLEAVVIMLLMVCGSGLNMGV